MSESQVALPELCTAGVDPVENLNHLLNRFVADFIEVIRVVSYGVQLCKPSQLFRIKSLQVVGEFVQLLQKLGNAFAQERGDSNPKWISGHFGLLVELKIFVNQVKVKVKVKLLTFVERGRFALE